MARLNPHNLTRHLTIGDHELRHRRTKLRILLTDNVDGWNVLPRYIADRRVDDVATVGVDVFRCVFGYGCWDVGVEDWDWICFDELEVILSRRE